MQGFKHDRLRRFVGLGDGALVRLQLDLGALPIVPHDGGAGSGGGVGQKRCRQCHVEIGGLSFLSCLSFWSCVSWG